MSEETGESLEDSIDTDFAFHQFQEAIEQTAHIVYITDTDGRIEYVNPAFEDITGYTAEEAIGQSSSFLQSGEHDDALYDDLWETILDGEQWKSEMIDERKNGDPLILEQTISPLSTPDGEIQKFIAVAQDITPRKQYEQHIEQQRDDLELLNQVLRHDIRNHLQVVAAYTDFIEDHIDEDGLEKLETLRENAENAISLTTTAGDMAEVMVHSNSDNTSVSLREVFMQELEKARSVHDTTVITVEDPIPQEEVIANSMLDSVFRNLLNNAIQHNDKDIPELMVSTEEDEDTVTILIADNGPGIPDAQKETIFGKGEKGLDSRGTGIGLYLVSSLVDSYDGSIQVSDNDPEGSIFSICLNKTE